jgi:hypothetical protein
MNRNVERDVVLQPLNMAVEPVDERNASLAASALPGLAVCAAAASISLVIAP